MQATVDRRSGTAPEAGTERCGSALLGWLWIGLGGLALATLFMPVLWLEGVAGGALVLGGSAQSVQALRRRRAADFVPCLLAGLTSFGAGTVLLTHLLGGVLPLVLTTFFAMQGALALWQAATVPDREARFGVFSGGLLSVLLALAIVAGWFCGAYPWLGAALGLERMAAGAALRHSSRS